VLPVNQEGLRMMTRAPSFLSSSLRGQWNTVVVHFIHPPWAESSPATGDAPACGFQGEVRSWPSAMNSVSSLKR